MALGDPILLPAAGGGSGGGTLIGVTIITALGAGNFVPNALSKYLRVRIAGGGGGAGSALSAGAGTAAGGAGGGSGGYVEKWYAAPLLASYPYVVGAGGAGVAASVNGTGVTGGTTSFNTPDMIALGGTGGDSTAATATIRSNKSGLGGAASIAGGNGFARAGRPGAIGQVIVQSGPYIGFGGQGGDNPLGQGGAQIWATGAGSSAAGNAGVFGGGGGGGAQAETSVDRAGGAGGNGVIIIEEYA